MPRVVPAPEAGNTPLLEVDGLFAKLECTNPCGSIKDRMAVYVLEESERRGLLDPSRGRGIVEATSGNTGIALSYFARRKGYDVAIVMPENMTEERKEVIRSLGAELILVSERGSFAEAVAVRDDIARARGWFNFDQFANPLNVECHFNTTGEEILRQLPELTPAPLGAFVAGVGTGGTLMGVAKKIRTRFPRAHIAAVEPAESAVLSGGKPGPHGIYGIGDGFIPEIVSDGEGWLSPLIDEVVVIGSADAKQAADYLSDHRGLCVGVSSGANFLAASVLRERFSPVVTVFADGYHRYRSLGLHRCAGGCRFEHDLVV